LLYKISLEKQGLSIKHVKRNPRLHKNVLEIFLNLPTSNKLFSEKNPSYNLKVFQKSNFKNGIPFLLFTV
jgi:hypothetical protein